MQQSPTTRQYVRWIPVRGANAVLGFLRVVERALDSDFLAVYNSGRNREPVTLDLYKTTFLLGRFDRGDNTFEVAVDSHSYGVEFWRSVHGFVEVVRE
jgi:hypothetical protein